MIRAILRYPVEPRRSAASGGPPHGRGVRHLGQQHQRRTPERHWRPRRRRHEPWWPQRA